MSKPHLSCQWGFLFISLYDNYLYYSIVIAPRMSYARWGRQ
jgi:hypothetical protein